MNLKEDLEILYQFNNLRDRAKELREQGLQSLKPIKNIKEKILDNGKKELEINVAKGTEAEKVWKNEYEKWIASANYVEAALLFKTQNHRDISESDEENNSVIVNEIFYRLLIGGQGARLSHLVAATGETKRISEAISYLRGRLAEPLKIEEIARHFGMSVSGFHAQFKSVTAMSPLQFQKQIRLQEARRLMLGDNLDAAHAGFRVGYEDPAYFSRDYKNLFGAPPLRDISKLRSHLEN
jgi:AraC-like DNA-binding protein